MFYDRVLKVENVGQGKTALITLGLGATYDKIILLLGGGLVLAKVGEIRCKANDIEFWTDTGPQIIDRLKYAGVDVSDVAQIPIDFTEPHARGDASQQYLASVPANLLKKFTVEVDLAADAGVGVTLAAAAVFRGPTKNPFILKRRKFNFYQAGAADNDLFLPSGVAGGIIKRVWLHDAAKIDALMLRVGGFIAMNYKTMAELQDEQLRNKLTPQAGIDVLDFVQDGNLQGALNTAAGQEVKLTATFNNACALVGYIDYIDPIDRLK